MTYQLCSLFLTQYVINITVRTLLANTTARFPNRELCFLQINLNSQFNVVSILIKSWDNKFIIVVSICQRTFCFLWCLLNNHIFNIETFSKNSIFNENFLIDCERRYYKWFQIGMFNHIFNIDIFSINIQYFINISNIFVGVGGLEPPKPEGDRFTVCCNCHYATPPIKNVIERCCVYHTYLI